MTLQANKALVLATTRHCNQTDKAGEPYIYHVLRVGMKFELDWLRAIGFLHDIIEDTPTTVEDLKALAFPDHIIQNVLALTKMPEETYANYIQRVSCYPDAKRVKIADLEDNMNLTRLPFSLTDKDWERYRKYHDAWRNLTA